jgi:hypothetical protein
MNKLYTAIATLLLAFLLSVPVLAQEATQAVESVPTVETVATEVAAPPVTSEPATDIHNAVDDVIEFFTNNLPIIFMGIALVMSIKQVGKPQTQAEYDAEKKAIAIDREEVKKTKTMLDDLMVEGRYIVNEMRGIAQTPATQPTTTVTTGNGTDTTITVSQPPPVIYPSQPPVGNTGTSTTDVSTPPFVPMPEAPHTITRNFGVTDSSFEKTVNGTRRVIHTPVNTSPLFSTLDAAGKEYPYPSVNVNSAYGVQFDIAYTAGAWGFTILETLVNGAAYKVRLDYTAQITGDKVDSLAEWLSHELDVNGKVTGVSQGVMNGVSYAEWGITGGHLPVMITPRIRCNWASAGSESKISWQRLTITPVDYGLAG